MVASIYHDLYFARNASSEVKLQGALFTPRSDPRPQEYPDVPKSCVPLGGLAGDLLGNLKLDRPGEGKLRAHYANHTSVPVSIFNSKD